ncbi:polypeptide N-acetylgalactosaminyltransferase 11 [Strongylocentrotus purpuratus]|uniref:Polypeptide N-acetylgalactosaminyltransferase n=1 Tax=Strongylocentrotus purpuratus TaxID=7668 RepID=A0A7M7P7H0_STRPU|nr:polypeptide N-acetylgalactosaminyltransferase 11 [Strongylocentrotus purpuratus]
MSTKIPLIRCFCYGITISSIIWLILIYIFLSDVGKDAPSGLPGVKYAPGRVKMIPRHRGGARPPLGVGGGVEEEDKRWRVNNLVMQDGGGNDLNAMRFNPKVLNPKNALYKKQGKPMREKQRLKADAQGDWGEDELGMVRTDEERSIRDGGYRQHAFNELISQRIGFHRNVTDTRNPLCKYQVYSEELPTVSIVICFYNEAWSTLLRTVYSVLDRTPRRLIHELILVDDFSELTHLKKELDQYMSKNFNGLVHVIHNGQREGLIRARTIGARYATGDVLMFLDSHCEVNEQWLEPLLERIKADSHTVVCPIIDIINHDTFAYTASPLVKGGFNWGMHFKWDTIRSRQLVGKEDYVKPIESPTMAGGLFAMNREYFHKLGDYDEGMDIWGGENLEISFRIWQCGGKLEIVPCSRVGHVFRKRRPYGSPNRQDTTTKNAVRVAEVWMDEYKEHFYQVQPKAKNIDYGDISSRVALREELKCKSFKWYLDTVYPEMRTPNDTKGRTGGVVEGGGGMQRMQRKAPQTSLRKGKLKHSLTGLCLVPKAELVKGTELILGDCDRLGDTNTMTWYQTSVEELKLGDAICMDMSESNSASLPQLRKCDGMGGSQRWRIKDKNIYHPVSGQCLSIKQFGSIQMAQLDICSSDPMQEWEYLIHR